MLQALQNTVKWKEYRLKILCAFIHKNLALSEVFVRLSKSPVCLWVKNSLPHTLPVLHENQDEQWQSLPPPAHEASGPRALQLHTL